jgi:exonuclease VII large subunit
MNRRSEILLEDMHGKMQVIAEGHQMMVERMDRLETNLETKMEEGFKDQDQKRNLATQALTKRIDEVDQRLSQKIDAVADEVRELRTDIHPRLDDHETRIASLEGKPAA